MPKRALVPLAVLLAAAIPARAERIPWQHPSLELERAGVFEHGDRLRMEFCVSPKEGMAEGTVSVGFPQYRTPWGRWIDCVIAGVSVDRPLHASAETGPACFSVLVA